MEIGVCAHSREFTDMGGDVEISSALVGNYALK